ncbi:7-cyano-7-deazaguanine synthase QueC [Natronorubrum sulfidifaciens]|uniref:7-cyano-7-deazaguanine synthase n=1 Tax=Natronorubrum sulfidifaciens JCM 14089 TaxID=1230460 RepID=L9W323_9EURY|nr:7-cyano-7-deazaguanine synthase QueC [Natronorubrum sulfidifaciens]ELY43742.1 exoenzyme S synthesis protein B [Natronorubrum sulfidifaciens JCM 14089]
MTDDTTTTDESTAKRAVVLLSGGMDSATAAAEAHNRGYEIYALHTSYGQRTEDRELECARRLADELDAADFLRIETGHLAAIGASSLTDDDLEVADADMDSEEIPTSYVPFRNANLLAMAVSYAEANDCDAVFIGAHSEDFSGYPDCRPAFFEAFEQVVDVGTKPDTEISIEAPFVEWSKTDIAERGVDLEVPYEHTWSCYRENEPACGTCDACAFRLQAFQNIGVRDPITYAERPSYVGE